MSTTTTRRDEVKRGDIFRSSHGYRLLVTDVIDNAKNRTDGRYVQINGHLHAKASNKVVVERNPASSTVEVEDVKMFRVILDRQIKGASFGSTDDVIEAADPAAAEKAAIKAWAAASAGFYTYAPLLTIQLPEPRP